MQEDNIPLEYQDLIKALEETGEFSGKKIKFSKAQAKEAENFIKIFARKIVEFLNSRYPDNDFIMLLNLLNFDNLTKYDERQIENEKGKLLKIYTHVTKTENKKWPFNSIKLQDLNSDFDHTKLHLSKLKAKNISIEENEFIEKYNLVFPNLTSFLKLHNFISLLYYKNKINNPNNTNYSYRSGKAVFDKDYCKKQIS